MSTVEQTAPSDEQIEAGLPKPCGYKLLIALPQVEETYGDSGLVKAATVLRQEEISTVVAVVLDMGPDAYKDDKKFPNGAWCQVGDFVIIRAYSGTRFQLYGKEYRLINDDTVEGVVSDPRGYSRV